MKVTEQRHSLDVAQEGRAPQPSLGLGWIRVNAIPIQAAEAERSLGRNDTAFRRSSERGYGEAPILWHATALGMSDTNIIPGREVARLGSDLEQLKGLDLPPLTQLPRNEE
jgi:hypothetical protein